MKKRAFLFLALIGLGLVISGYLLYRGFVLLKAGAPPSIDLCAQILGAGCDESLRSASSWFLGIPWAGWGVVYYLTLGALALLGAIFREDFELEAAAGSFLLAGAGASGSLILAGILITGGAPFCPLCIVIHLINLALVPAILWISGRSLGGMLQAIRAGGAYVLRGRARSPREARWKTLGFATTALFSLVLYQWIFVEFKILRANQEPPFDAEHALADYESTIVQDLRIGPDDPNLGPADSPVRLVVFSNFECPGCRSFSGELYALAARFNGKIEIVFKYFAGAACRPGLEADRPSLACLAAWSAEAARLQGKFWQYYDAIFALESIEDEKTFSGLARDLNLDLERFEKDRGSPAVKNRVWTDVEEGRRLEIDATPAVFLQGRRVRDLRPEALAFLVEKELAKF